MTAKIRIAECAQIDLGTVPSNKAFIFLDSSDNVLKLKKDDQSIISLDSTKHYWQAAQATAQTAITTDTSLSVVETHTSSATVFVFNAGTGAITINKAGPFKFDINVTADTGTGSRQTSLARLQRWNGAAFVNIPASEAHTQGYGYHRNATSGEDTIDISPIITVVSGDIFRVVLSCASAGNINTIAVGTGFNIEEK